MNLQARNAAALKAGQAAYDHASPDGSVPFLQTADGANWLTNAAKDLIQGYALKIGGRVVAEPWQLGEKLTEIALANREEYGDGELEQIILFVVAGKIDEAQRSLCRLIGKDTAHQAAEEICATFSDSYVESMQDNIE